MNTLFKRLAWLLAGVVFATAAQAGKIEMTDKPAKRSIYLGLIGGYGETTWSNIVGHDGQTLIVTPEAAKEGGADIGMQVGFEVNRGFALEFGYLHFSDASLYFDSDAQAVLNVGHRMVTKTQAVFFDTKIYTPLSRDDRWRLYGKIGMEATNRRDVLMTYKWRVGAIFGMGFSYDQGEHWMYQLGFDYLSGYGDSEVEPLNKYVPFVYALNASVSYKFAV